jgi:hypothetical protein
MIDHVPAQESTRQERSLLRCESRPRGRASQQAAGGDDRVSPRASQCTVRRLRRSIREPSDGLRPSRSRREALHAVLRPRGAKSRTEILIEAAKCDVVCVNCHRLRSRRRHRDWLANRIVSALPGTDVRRTRWRYHAEVLDQLRSVPCADCGERFAQCSMDFDHRDPATKLARVTSMVGRAGLQRILAEAAKCDIVCANCHRRRTLERRSKQVA